MKKRLLTIALALLLTLACAFNVLACGSSKTGSASKDGTYYHYANGEYDEQNYVIIKDNKVSAAYIDGQSVKDSGATVTVKFSGNDFTVTMSAQGGKMVYSGTVKNGVAHVTEQEIYEGTTSAGSLPMDLWFCKKNKTPDDFNGGNNNNNNDNNDNNDNNNNGDNKVPDDLTPDGFVPNNFPVDNSFQGAISQESYSSKDSAARAFVSTEINGEARSATFKSYTKKEDVDTSRATEFGLTAQEASHVTSIEKGEVAYEESSTGARNAQRAGGTIAVKGPVYTIYILVIDWSEYKYFAPELNKGDIITKSYFDSVFDESKYTNLTITEHVTSNVEAGSGKFTTTAVTIMDAVMYVTEEAVYGTVTMSQEMSVGGNTMESGSSVTEIYIDKVAGVAYARIDHGNWQRGNNVNIYDYILPEMDNSWFVKTDYGFSLNGEKFSMFIEKQANQVASSIGGGNAMHYSNMDASVGYKVRDGRIDETKVTMTCDISGSGVGGTVVSESTDSYTDYGTTAVPSKASLGISESIVF